MHPALLIIRRTIFLPAQHKYVAPQNGLPHLHWQLRNPNLLRRKPDRTHDPKRRAGLDLPHVLQRRHTLFCPRPPLGDSYRLH